MKLLTDKSSSVGLYIHIPFCRKKCAYCDFYSSFLSEELLNQYTEALEKYIEIQGCKFSRPVDTVYLGGGTPSLLKGRLPDLLDKIRRCFNVAGNAEITLEANPDGEFEEAVKYAAAAGVNRLSIGVQSGNDEDLALLGRTHTAYEAAMAFDAARKSGFDNISLDVMLGLPNSDKKSLERSLRFITELDPEHISAYILKLEPNTRLFHERGKFNFPDDDSLAAQYLFMCEYLEEKGYGHYEISNFCKPEKYSRHNLKYWDCREYLGLGPGAHSFIRGERFYYTRDLRAFIKGCAPTSDGIGGDAEEYLMLRLRLKDGIRFNEFENRYKTELPQRLIDKAHMYERNGLVRFDGGGFFLTDEGMLVSNSIITELAQEL